MEQFNWKECVSKFPPSWSQNLAEERGVPPVRFESIREHAWIGACYVQKWHTRCIAFPLCDENGEAYRAHCRSPQRGDDGKWEWAYEPFPDPLKRPISAMLFGSLANATTCHLFESQWDAIALIDRLDLMDEIDSGQVCLVATRGAQYAAQQLGSFKWPEGINLYAFPQCDKAARDWLENVIQAVDGCYVVEIPQGLNGIKDLNDWTKVGGATAYDIEAAIEHAEMRKPQTEPEPEPDEEAKRTAAFSACTSQGPELLKIDIPPRAIIIADWFKEGDLGFVFAYRGAGKTWFVIALCIALTEGTPFGPWSVSGKWPILYIDGEMNHEDDKERILGLNGSIPAKLYVLNHEVLFQKEGMVMDLASETDQKVITALCVEKGIKGVVLDNLGCLFTGVKENEADEWGKVLPWLLDLRRRRISAVVVHHSGHDTSRMRGTVKREDSAAWVIRLDNKKEDFSEPGADFISRFLKYRGKKIALDYQWTFETLPDGSVVMTYQEASRADLLLQWVSNGLTRCEDIARELGVSKGTISKLATRLIKEGKLAKGARGQGYLIP